MTIEDTDCARSLRSPKAVALRRDMLHQPHIAPLTNFVAKLRAEHSDWEIPDFDPLDGGVNADMLFLLEKPGPMTSAAGGGSGFISRNNNDPTAEAAFGFMKQADLPRNRTIFWNIIPGWNGSIEIKNKTTKEVTRGAEALKSLLPLIPKLRTIVPRRKESSAGKAACRRHRTQDFSLGASVAACTGLATGRIGQDSIHLAAGGRLAASGSLPAGAWRAAGRGGASTRLS
jgi:hypothetical protein